MIVGVMMFWQLIRAVDVDGSKTTDNCTNDVILPTKGGRQALLGKTFNCEGAQVDFVDPLVFIFRLALVAKLDNHIIREPYMIIQFLQNRTRH